jgi:hypothetical protein
LPPKEQRPRGVSSNRYIHGGCVNEKESGKSPTYESWCAMRTRCRNPNAKIYQKYGAKGITIDPVWDDFVVFLRDMGERPLGTTLDRYPDSAGNYTPNNCRWATPKEQARNQKQRKKYTYEGRSLILSEWADATGIPLATLKSRIVNMKWSVKRALTTPLGCASRGQPQPAFVPLPIENKPMLLNEWGKANGLADGTVYARFRLGSLPIVVVERAGRRTYVVTDEEKMKTWKPRRHKSPKRH